MPARVAKRKPTAPRKAAKTRTPVSKSRDLDEDDASESNDDDNSSGENEGEANNSDSEDESREDTSWANPIRRSLAKALEGFERGAKTKKLTTQMAAEKKTQFKSIFSSWKKKAEGRVWKHGKVRQLCFTLQNYYSKADLLARKLKGKDAELVSLLIPIAKELGFGLYGADIYLYRDGMVNHDDEDDEGYDEDEDERENKSEKPLKWSGGTEDEFYSSDTVDLVRKKEEKDLDVRGVEQFVPWAFGEREKPSERESEAWRGTSENLRCTYTATALVFRPIDLESKRAGKKAMKQQATSKKRALTTKGRQPPAKRKKLND